MLSFGMLEDPAVVLVLLTWLITLVLSISPAKRWAGSRKCGGGPRWGSVIGLPAQLLFLPTIFVLACLDKGDQKWGWLVGSYEQMTENRYQTYESMFALLFAAMLAKDYVLISMSPLIHLHHFGCYVGHTFVIFAIPRGFPVYFAGVVALEFGTGFYNIYLLAKTAEGRDKPPLRPYAIIYLVMMTLSNAMAFICGCLGVMLIESFGGKLFYLLVTAIFVLLRQKEAIEEMLAIKQGKRGKIE